MRRYTKIGILVGIVAFIFIGAIFSKQSFDPDHACEKDGQICTGLKYEAGLAIANVYDHPYSKTLILILLLPVLIGVIADKTKNDTNKNSSI